MLDYYHLPQYYSTVTQCETKFHWYLYGEFRTYSSGVINFGFRCRVTTGYLRIPAIYWVLPTQRCWHLFTYNLCRCVVYYHFEMYSAHGHTTYSNSPSPIFEISTSPSLLVKKTWFFHQKCTFRTLLKVTKACVP